jgi:hypothetical protein
MLCCAFAVSCRIVLCVQQPAVEGGLGRVQVIDKLSRARLPALYGAVDVLVQPSRGEGWGLPMVEAMACGAKNAFATPHLCIKTVNLPRQARDKHRKS